MRTDLAYLHASDYRVTTPLYEGPLDLLLQLIERAELDITKLALALVTDQFLLHLRNMTEGEAEEVSAFLVIAAKLLQIKSEVLLPRAPARDESDEQSGDSLVHQLLEYKRFKDLSEQLSVRESAGLRTYLRLAYLPKQASRVHLDDLDLSDLVTAARDVFQRELRSKQRPSLNTVVPEPVVTIREKIRLITGLLRRHGKTTFRKLVGEKRSQPEIVVTFLAVLELVKSYLVHVRQPALFGEIEVEVAGPWSEMDEFELEFGE